MNPRSYCYGCPHATEPKKQYQLVIMTEEGKAHRCGKLYDWNGIQEAVKEVRELYAKHGVTHHVGYMEV
jgi:hypothetical protein